MAQSVTNGRDLELTLVGDLSGALKFKKYTRSKHKEDGFEQAGRRFQRWLRRRYFALSAGGGEWKPLAESTIKQKESLARWGRISVQPRWILRRQDVLVNSIEFEKQPMGFRVGFMTVKRYPKIYKSEQSRTVRYVAMQHQVGHGRLPQRKIIVIPPQAVVKAALEDVRRNLFKFVQEINPKGFRRV